MYIGEPREAVADDCVIAAQPLAFIEERRASRGRALTGVKTARPICVIEAAAADAFDPHQHVGADPGSAADARVEVDTDATGRIGVSGEIDAEATDQDVIANATIEDVITEIGRASCRQG